MQPILNDVFLFQDTCHVYIIRSGSDAVLIDFGSGDVLDHLHEIGVTRVTDILMTHHHRDQGQGLPRAAAAGICIWVPFIEQDLFASADAHWQAREVMNNYNMRQDRFSLLASVPITGTLLDYEERRFGDHTFVVVPTPGHTIGAISLMTTIEGQCLAFTGDLIAGPGQVWSMAATQWTYNGAEGAAAGIASLLDLKDRRPNLLLPSHGKPMHDPDTAIDLLVERFWQLLKLRRQNLHIFQLREHPYQAVTPHLLWHRASVANTYVLLSESKKAMFFDFGYDFMTGFTAGYDRASRRPWLYTIPTLKRQFGIESIDVVIPTHFHDDHIAGINVLKRVEGTQAWVADLFADILERPERYDLPCLWYDPIAVDRVLPLEVPFQWEEYTLTLYPLPGHTRYAVAIAVEVDGQRVLVTGDQYQGNAGLELNYVYPNRFLADDYIKSADLYRRLNPNIILAGHWEPLHVPQGYFDQLREMGTELARLHHELLWQRMELGEEDFLARLSPYQINVYKGQFFEVQAEIRNPYRTAADVSVQLVVPEGWIVTRASCEDEPLTLTSNTVSQQFEGGSSHVLTFQVTSPLGTKVRRARIAVDLTINQQRFGQEAEALVTIL